MPSQARHHLILSLGFRRDSSTIYPIDVFPAHISSWLRPLKRKNLARLIHYYMITLSVHWTVTHAHICSFSFFVFWSTLWCRKKFAISSPSEFLVTVVSAFVHCVYRFLLSKLQLQHFCQHSFAYPTSKVSPAIPLTLCSAHLTLTVLGKAVLLSRAAVPSPIEKVYIPSVRWGACKYCEGPLVVIKCLLF